MDQKKQIVERMKEVKFTPFPNGGGLDVSVKHQLPDHAFEAIADHLLANGVIVPPCQVGQTVYSCLGYAYKVKKIVIESNSNHINFVFESGLNGQLIFDETCFGKTVFFTKEEAEALKERGADGKQKPVSRP